MFPLEFTRPWMLWVLLAATPVVGFYFYKSLSDFPRKQRIVSLVTRLLIVFLIALSLSGLTLLHPTKSKYFIFLADQSSSVGKNGEEMVEEFLADASKHQGNNQFAYIPFASRAGMVQDEPVVYGENPSILNLDKKPENTEAKSSAPTPGTNGDSSKENKSASENSEETDGTETESLLPSKRNTELRDGTNIEDAIETAIGFMPPGFVPEIVLITDGNETIGDSIATAAQSNIPISTFPLPIRTEPEVQVSEISLPAEVREGEPFYVEVIVHSNHKDEGKIEVFRGDHKVISETKKFKVGENRFLFQQTVERQRLAAFTARISSLKEDTLLDNNMDTGLVYTSGKPRVLIIESNPNLIRELAYALEKEGIQVDVRPPQGMPESLSDLQNYELLMLSNVPATKLTQQQMQIARTYVQELGGGFIMLGGEQSFGLGGYYRSTLEEILPVRSDFEKEKETPSIAMVLVIDKSGSMSGEKIEMAKSAARSAAELLGRRDQVAVIAFDGDTYVLSEMQSARNKGKISDEIGRLEASGGTSMYPGMEMSYEMLLAASAKLKHVILLTDGVSSPGDFEGIAQQMASSKMTISTVAVGEGSDTELLEQIAKIGKGRYYFTTDAAQVPQIFAKETVTASKSAIDEQPFLPQVLRATHALSEVDMNSAPFLLGYVMTRPKPTCEVILATEKGDPLLAWWRYGLGMTAAFTSDAKNRWAAEWMTWPGYGKFWTQVIRQTMRKNDAKGVAIQVARQGRQVSMDLDAVNELGQFLNHAAVEVTLIDPQLKRSKVTMNQSAPGRYKTDFATPLSGSYHMEVAVKQNDKVVYRQSRGVSIGYTDELRIRPTNETLLKAIAEVSNGQYSPDIKEFFNKSDKSTTRPTPIWPYLIAAAALLLVMDVALRRIDFSLHWPFSKSVA